MPPAMPFIEISSIFLLSLWVSSSTKTPTTAEIGDWAKGLYFVELRDEKGNVHTEKFVKE
jgi:hypothetical protein